MARSYTSVVISTDVLRTIAAAFDVIQSLGSPGRTPDTKN
jgi:hypothetical protein